MALTVGSLFSGIGGIDLGLERAGMVTRWFVEWDAHCQNVLRRHWPGFPVYGDITAVDWETVERVDVLAGGFPCQPVSLAGRGLAQNDDRWLWPAFRDAISALRPRYVLVENVPGLLQRGLGLVLGDLAALGFDAEWDCIPASAVGAPHHRDRLWIAAYPSRVQPGRQEQRAEWERARPSGQSLDTGRPHPSRAGQSEQSLSDVADAERAGLERATGPWIAGEGRTPVVASGGGEALAAAASLGFSGSREPVESVYPAPNPHRQAGEPLDGRLAEQWITEPDVGRVADGVPHRVDRLRALGNAVVPQVVEWIGRRIVAFDEARKVSVA